MSFIYNPRESKIIESQSSYKVNPMKIFLIFLVAVFFGKTFSCHSLSYILSSIRCSRLSDRSCLERHWEESSRSCSCGSRWVESKGPPWQKEGRERQIIKESFPDNTIDNIKFVTDESKNNQFIFCVRFDKHFNISS